MAESAALDKYGCDLSLDLGGWSVRGPVVIDVYLFQFGVHVGGGCFRCVKLHFRVGVIDGEVHEDVER
jgi:hypothetical protein